MQVQTITAGPLESFVELVRNVVNSLLASLRRRFAKTVSIMSAVCRKAGIDKSETQVQVYAELARPVPFPMEAKELQRIKEYDKQISKLECIRRRTKKLRIKKKLTKRIRQLEAKSLVMSWRCLQGNG